MILEIKNPSEDSIFQTQLTKDLLESFFEESQVEEVKVSFIDSYANTACAYILFDSDDGRAIERTVLLLPATNSFIICKDYDELAHTLDHFRDPDTPIAFQSVCLKMTVAESK